MPVTSVLPRALLAVGLLVVCSDVAATDGPIEARQRLMVSMIKATKVPRAMVQKKADFDADAVTAAVKQVLEATAVLPSLFPDGSTDEKSAALPAIFANRADFEARFLDLEKAAVELAFAAQQRPDDFAYAYDEFSHVCDACHMKYRRKEDPSRHEAAPK